MSNTIISNINNSSISIGNKTELPKLNFLPIGNKIITDRPKIEETTKGGIIKSDEMIAEEKEKAQKEQYFTVLAIGDEVTKVKVGDEILISGNIMATVINGIDCCFTYESNILGKKC